MYRGILAVVAGLGLMYAYTAAAQESDLVRYEREMFIAAADNNASAPGSNDKTSLGSKKSGKNMNKQYRDAKSEGRGMDEKNAKHRMPHHAHHRHHKHHHKNYYRAPEGRAYRGEVRRYEAGQVYRSEKRAMENYMTDVAPNHQ